MKGSCIFDKTGQDPCQSHSQGGNNRNGNFGIFRNPVDIPFPKRRQRRREKLLPKDSKPRAIPKQLRSKKHEKERLPTWKDALRLQNFLYKER